MSSKYVQSVASNKTRFTQNPQNELEFSTMECAPKHTTTFNAGDIVPIYCAEILPHDTFDMDLDFVIRQTTSVVPVMGQLVADYYAFFVPNRVVNKSWKNVMGENTSGAWIAPEVTLAPLVGSKAQDFYRVPVDSVADYYGYPTQMDLSADLLRQCHDLKFRGYVDIYNNYFRDQNYMPPIPYSKLNVFNGFFEPTGKYISLNGLYDTDAPAINETNWSTVTSTDGSYPRGAVAKAVVGEGDATFSNITVGARKTSFSALGKPLKACKLHDYFTSVLPSPQKGREVVMPLLGEATLNTSATMRAFDSQYPLQLGYQNALNSQGVVAYDNLGNTATLSQGTLGGTTVTANPVVGTNAYVDLSTGNIGMSVTDMRFSSALQKVYELLGRGGSRYTEFINSFFGLEVDNPFDDIPTFLGHFRRDLDLYQVAQTSATQSVESGASTPQGNLSAFGYTAKNGSLFHKTFVEHGYIHIMMVVRHHNIYPSFMGRDNFRMSQLDFYMPQLANISEQPVYAREINPTANNLSQVFGYNEAWAEYRFEPDRVSGYMRPGVPNSLAYWNYADDYDMSLSFANADFLTSNTEEIVKRSTALQEVDTSPQFKGEFVFRIKKERPMPLFSVPGMDIF